MVQLSRCLQPARNLTHAKPRTRRRSDGAMDARPALHDGARRRGPALLERRGSGAGQRADRRGDRGGTRRRGGVRLGRGPGDRAGHAEGGQRVSQRPPREGRAAASTGHEQLAARRAARRTNAGRRPGGGGRARHPRRRPEVAEGYPSSRLAHRHATPVGHGRQRHHASSRRHGPCRRAARSWPSGLHPREDPPRRPRRAGPRSRGRHRHRRTLHR